MKNFKLEKDKWTKITDLNCLVQLKLLDSIRVYWYEGELDPNKIVPSPDEQSDCCILNSGTKAHLTTLDKEYKNTIGTLWVFPQKSINLTVLELKEC